MARSLQVVQLVSEAYGRAIHARTGEKDGTGQDGDGAAEDSALTGEARTAVFDFRGVTCDPNSGKERRAADRRAV